MCCKYYQPLHGASAEMCSYVYVNDVHVVNTNNLCMELWQRCAVVYVNDVCVVNPINLYMELWQRCAVVYM